MTEAVKDLKDIQSAQEPEAAPVNEKKEPKVDALGRAYATGRRKESVARVWI